MRHAKIVRINRVENPNLHGAGSSPEKSAFISIYDTVVCEILQNFPVPLNNRKMSTLRYCAVVASGKSYVLNSIHCRFSLSEDRAVFLPMCT